MLGVDIVCDMPSDEYRGENTVGIRSEVPSRYGILVW